MSEAKLQCDAQINLIPLSAVPLPTEFNEVAKVSCARIIMRPLAVLTQVIVASEDAINEYFEAGDSIYQFWDKVLRPACLKVYQDTYGEQAASYLEKDEAFFDLERVVRAITPEPNNKLRTGLYAMVAHQ